MSKKMTSLKDVFIEELADLYSAEKQLVRAIPRMIKSTSSSDLKIALENHWEETKEHVKRLEYAFKNFDAKIPTKTCKAMKGLIEEGVDVIKESDASMTRDAALIGAAQRVEHYEMAGYGTAVAHASVLGFDRVRQLLEETLSEEKNANLSLNHLAEEEINLQAK